MNRWLLIAPALAGCGNEAPAVTGWASRTTATPAKG